MRAHEEREHSELMIEFRRVGITWAAFGELCRRNAPNEPVEPDGSFNMSLDYGATTKFLRTLPDNLGQEGFLAAWEKTFAEPARKRLEAAMKKWSEKNNSRPDSSGGAGA